MEIKQYTIDCRRFTSKADTHRYLAEVFAFPEYYGNNLDALYDSLSELPSCIIRMTYPWALAGLGEYGISLLRVFQDIALERSDIQLV
ncbi:MAG: barstar family protein [Clostridia bacterium]|nr:barstar family protein [Clostridia bacterium]